jgi:ELWxxDGT repeat protein
MLAATLLAEINSSSMILGPNLMPDSESRGKTSVALNDSFYYADGTSVRKSNASGSIQLVDVAPGNDFALIHWMEVSGDRLYFSANGQFWVSDGTPSGTRTMFEDPGVCSYPEFLVDVNGTLFFAASDREHGYELWASDGTQAGTRMVQDLVPGADFPYIASITKVGNQVFFVAGLTGSGTGRELWRSDGTAAGTQLVTDLIPGTDSSFPQDLTAVGDRLYFHIPVPGVGGQLWTTDGTPDGTQPVLTEDGNSIWNTSSRCALGASLLFAAADTAGSELWRADGAAAIRVRDIRPGAEGSSPSSLTTLGSRVYFSANDGLTGSELWSSDGTAAGTTLFVDLNLSGDSFPSLLVNNAGLLFFAADDGTHGMEVWRSDGTTTGTFLLRDVNPGTGAAISYPPVLKGTGGALFFVADDGVNSSQIWLSDGTSSGTRMSSTPRLLQLGGNPAYLTEINGTLFFAANSEGLESSDELWKSDGTPEGTALVKDLSPDSEGAFIVSFQPLSGSLYFIAANSGYQYEIWKSDGTEDGTQRLKDINPGGSIGRAVFTEFGNHLYFNADDGVNGVELWRTDGTEAGTELLADINSGAAGSDPFARIAAFGSLFFTADDGVHGTELWKTNGTAEGTTLVRDINPGGSSRPEDFVMLNGLLYFTAVTPDHGSSIWVTDGTSDGTQLAVDIPPGPDSMAIRNLAAANGRLFFSVDDGVTGEELYSSDGTAAGTMQVRDINPGSASTIIDGLVVDSLGNTIYFAVADALHGRELWRTDGTTSGTYLLKDILPGPESSRATIVYSASGLIYFTANDGVHGEELWQTDGTLEGTQLLADLVPGISPAGFFGMRAIGDRLFIAAGPGADTELYTAPINFRPSDLKLSSQTVDENQPAGSFVGLLSAVDVNVSDTFTWTLVNGDGDSDNDLFTITGNTLKTTAALDFEFASSLSLRIRATDNHGQSTDRIFQITVGNLNDMPTLDTLADITVVEDSVTQLLNLTGISAGGEAQPLKVTAESSRPGLIPNPEVIYLSPDAFGVLRFRPAARSSGQATITVVIEDGGRDGDLTTITDNARFTRTFIITVQPTRPVITGPVGTVIVQRPKMTWQAVPGASAYQVWIGNRSTAQLPLLTATVSTTEYQPPENLALGRIEVYVRAVLANAIYGPWSVISRFTVATRAVISPLNQRQTTPRPEFSVVSIPGATTYEFQLDNRSTGQTQFLRATVNSPTWIPSIDLPLASYRVWARGLAADGTPAVWSAATDFLVVTPPNPMAPLSATFDRQPTFTWTAVPGAATYGFFLKDMNTGAIVANVSGLTTTSWTPPSRLPDGNYGWWAIGRPTSAGFQSNWSARLDFFVGGRPVITAPQGVVRTPRPVLEWNAVFGAVGYEVWLNRVTQGLPQIVLLKSVSVAATLFQVSEPLESGGQYRFWIRAISGSGEKSPWSKPADFSTALLTVFQAERPGIMIDVLESNADDTPAPQAIARLPADPQPTDAIVDAVICEMMQQLTPGVADTCRCV